jgi:hypothetical protein
MSGGRPQRQGFFSRVFSPPDGEETTTYSAEEVGAEEEPEGIVRSRSFTVERAVGVINDLPPEVPRQSALRIVRQTLAAAGISIEELGSSARAREAKLNSEIKLSQDRIMKLREDTDDVIRSLEDEIRKAREARDFGVSQEERKISAARSSLVDVEKVRDFFGLPGGKPRPDDEETDSVGDETQVMEHGDVDDTRIMRPRGPLSRDWDPDEDLPENRNP